VVPAVYELTRVKQLVHPSSGELEPWFNTPKSIDVVSDRLNMSFPEAKTFICDGILGLTPDDYCTIDPEPPPPADVYGIETRRVGWYVKLKAPDYRQLSILSFHPPTKPLRTVVGLTIK